MFNKDREKTVESASEVAPAKRGRKKKPVAVEKHFITTEYEVEKPIDELKSPAKPKAKDIIIENDPDDSDDEALELAEGDAVEEFMARFDSDTARYTMTVYQLPNFHIDGYTDVKRSNRRRLGSRPFNPKTYEQEIAVFYAKPGEINTFLCEVRKDGDYYRTLPVLHVEPASPDELSQFGVTPPLVSNPAAPPAPATAITITPPIDGSASLQAQLANLKELAEIGRTLNKMFTPPAPPPLPVAPAPEPVTEDRALMTLLLADEDAAARLRKSALAKLLGGGGESETNWADVINTLLQRGPEIVREAMSGLERMRQQAAAEQLPPQMWNNTQPAPASIESFQQYQELLTNVLNALALNHDAQEAAARVTAFTVLNPNYRDDVENFLGLPAEMLAPVIQQFPGAAQIPALPHFGRWITDFQTAYFGGNDDAGNPSPNVA